MRKLKFVIILILCFFSNTLMNGQEHLFHKMQDSISSIELRYYRPDFSNPFTDLNILGAVYDLQVQIPIHKSYNLLTAIPFVNADFEEFEAERGIGNISLGVQRKLKETDKELSGVMLNVFFPSSNTASGYLDFGLTTNFHDFAKFVGDALSIQLNYAHQYKIYQGFSMSGEIAPILVVSVGENANDTELLLRYGISAMYDFGSFNLRTEFNGEGILTESELNDKFFQGLSFGAQLTQGKFKPGFFVYRSLDGNFNSSLDGMIALVFAFEL